MTGIIKVFIFVHYRTISYPAEDIALSMKYFHSSTTALKIHAGVEDTVLSRQNSFSHCTMLLHIKLPYFIHTFPNKINDSIHLQWEFNMQRSFKKCQQIQWGNIPTWARASKSFSCVSLRLEAFIHMFGLFHAAIWLEKQVGAPNSRNSWFCMWIQYIFQMHIIQWKTQPVVTQGVSVCVDMHRFFL